MNSLSGASQSCRACRIRASDYTPETCPSQFAVVATDEATKQRAYRRVKYAFAAVGTTSFDELITGLDNSEYIHMLYQAGFRAIVLQIGENGKHVPWKWVLLNRRNPEREPFKCYYYRTSDEYYDDIEHASLVICHAGAGTLLTALKARRPIITVPNSRLMGDHQQELAQGLADKGHVLIASQGLELATAISTIIRGQSLLPYPFYKIVEPKPESPPLRTILQQWLVDETKLMAVLGPGGHTEEMISMLEVVGKSVLKNVHYVASNGDIGSSTRLEKSWLSDNGIVSYSTIPRARKVGQSCFTSIFTFLYALFSSLSLLLSSKPSVILCNGPGTCLPVCFAAFLLRMVRLIKPRIVYVESFARVSTLSLTGRILYKFRLCDEFLVMWSGVSEVYNRVEYVELLM